MYTTPPIEFTPAAFVTKLLHVITDFLTPTIHLIGGLVAGAIVGGIFVIVVIAVWYELLSLEGRNAAKPGPELE